MRTFYQVKSEEFGTVVLRRRKIAKALRWWLREKGLPCEHGLLPMSLNNNHLINGTVNNENVYESDN
jgi:hypothetical protein